MDQERAAEIVGLISSAKIAVYGDFALDAYWILDSRGGEVSVETGKVSQAVKNHYYSLGGASNIAANIAALNPAGLFTIGGIGSDIFGRELTRQLADINADTGGLVPQAEDFDTITFVKRYLEDEEDRRIDFGFFNKRSLSTDAKILEYIERALAEFDVLLFNQQVPGSLNNRNFIRKCNELFEEYKDTIVLLDSRHYGGHFSSVYRKVNEVEAARLNGEKMSPGEPVPPDLLKNYGIRLYRRSKKPLFITRGAKGIFVVDRESIHEIPGIQLNKKLDPVGAGDTVMSALGLCLAAGLSPVEAAEFANFAAGVTVQKLFKTGTAAPEEILEISRDPDYIYQPDLAADIRSAHYCEASRNVEVCCSRMEGEGLQIRHAVFDHDGTVSVLREGWEKVMEKVMVEAIFGAQYSSAGPDEVHKVREYVLEYIDRSTGVQTIVQMEALAEMVKDFGYVPEREILDKFGYKTRYNRALMESVEQRIAAYKAGRLTETDVTIKGSVEFIKRLKKSGVKLYLASGTDVEDVIREAQVLGYADLFEGEIYGAVGDITKYSKKQVIREILDKNRLNGAELAVIGDGPVEIRECRKAGGIAVGVASNEVRRCGLNEHKRKRLIQAGAHFIVPDFTESDSLLSILLNTC